MAMRGQLFRHDRQWALRLAHRWAGRLVLTGHLPCVTVGKSQQRRQGGWVGGGAGAPQGAACGGGDEYSDDDDTGFVATPVLRQDDFVAAELQGSDDDSSSTRSAYGFHRWRGAPARPPALPPASLPVHQLAPPPAPPPACQPKTLTMRASGCDLPLRGHLLPHDCTVACCTASIRDDHPSDSAWACWSSHVLEA